MITIPKASWMNLVIMKGNGATSISRFFDVIVLLELVANNNSLFDIMEKMKPKNVSKFESV